MSSPTPPSAARTGVRDCIFLGGLWAYLWLPLLLGREVLFARDVRIFTVPAKQYLVERFAAGEIPAWTPHFSTGLPFLADVSNQVFYPLNLLLWPALHIYGGSEVGFDVGVTWFLIAHSLGAMLALRCLAGVLGAPGIAALGAAALYGLSGYVICITDNLTYLPAVLWAPLALAAYVKGLQTGSYRYSGLSAVCVAALLLAGDAQNPLLLALTAALLSIGQSPGSPARPAFRVLHLGLSFALAAALAAVQILPTMQLVAWSHRGGGLHLDTVSAFSFAPERLVELVAPFVLGARFPAGEFFAPERYPRFGAGWVDSVYLGVIPVLLAALGLRHRLRAGWPWLVIALVCGALALGQHGPFFGPLIEALPPLRLARYPEKLLFWVTLAAAVLAAFGMAQLERRPETGRHLGLIALVVLAGAAAAPAAFWPATAFSAQSTLWASRGIPGVTHAQGYWVHLGVLATLLAGAFFVRRFAPAHRYLLVVALLDLAWMHRGHLPGAPTALFEPRPELLDELALDSEQPVRVHFDHTNLAAVASYRGSGPWARVLSSHSAVSREAVPHFSTLFANALGHERLRPNEGARYGIRYHNGQLSPLQPNRHFELETIWLSAYPRSVLELAGVGYLITSLAPVNAAWRELVSPENAMEIPELNLRVLRVPEPRPFAYLGTQIVVAGSPRTALPHLAQASPDTVVLDAPLPRPGAASVTSSGHDSVVTVRRPAPERIEVTVDARHNERILVVSESFFPGWSATVNGAEQPVVQAQLRFLGVPLQPGRSEVTLTYSVGHLRAGSIISLAALGAVVLLGFTRPFDPGLSPPPVRPVRGAGWGVE